MSTPEMASRWSRAGVLIAVLLVAITTVAAIAMRMTVGISFSTLPFAAVGAALVWRRRGVVIGWVLLVFAILWSVTFFATELALSAHHPVVVLVSAWLCEWTWFAALVSVFVILPIVFPTGAPHRRWLRGVLWSTVGMVVVFVALTTVQSQFSPDNATVVDNPWALLPLTDVEEVSFPFVLPLLILGPVAAVMRYRGSQESEREQIRWFMYALVATAAIFFSINIAAEFMPVAMEETGALVEAILLGGALSLPPLGIWIAITRHRLFDIDRLLSRTVSYGLVTALLVGLFGGSVFVLSLVLPVEGDLPVAVSTLIAAAVFNPLRRRVQNAVDRRFNRSRYNARLFVESFSHRLRSEPHLDGIGAELEEAVRFTMEPSSVSLWLRDTEW